MTRPIDIVRKLCPRAKPSYATAFERGAAQLAAYGITPPLRLAHFLAQAFHETGGLTIEWESGNYSAARLLEVFGVGHHTAAITSSEAEKLAYKPEAIFERVYGLGNSKKARELGNTQPGDGFKYRGGGILQTTGRANYRRMGQKCGVDFEGHPELVLSAEHALKPALAEWAESNLNVAADADDIMTITRRINGGYNGIDGRKEWFRKIRPLIDTVDLSAPAVAPTPAPVPDAEPVPPAPKPPLPARNVAVAGSLFAGLVAALRAHSVEIAVGGIAVAVIVAIIIHLIFKKRD
jgi:putative chitinase